MRWPPPSPELQEAIEALYRQPSPVFRHPCGFRTDDVTVPSRAQWADHLAHCDATWLENRS